MAPKNTSFDLSTRFDKKMKTKTKTKNMKKTNKKLKLSNSEKKKILYLCFLERHSEDRVSYVVRSIELARLLKSGDNDSVRQLKKVGYKAGDEHLPSSIGCGLFGSQILFAAGFTPATEKPHPKFTTYQKDVYAFETDPKKLQVDDDGVSNILKMDGKLVNDKLFPLMVVLGGKLCAISRRYVPGIAFEVFDPESKTWHDLPNPPFWDDSDNSWQVSYAITGTKMFISYGSSSPVFCFDISQENREWRRVDSMCGPFNFDNNALVLDLPGHPNKKLLFGCRCRRCVYNWKLGVYIMSLDEGRESITQVANVDLPAVLPRGYFAGAYFTLHVGGQKGCLVAPRLRLPYGEEPRYGEVGSHKITGIAIPFEFEVDFSKIDEDPINCLTLEFLPSRVFEFYTSPSTFPDCGHKGCFIV